MSDEIFDRVKAIHQTSTDAEWATSDAGRALLARAINSGSPQTRTIRPRRRRVAVGAIAAAVVLTGTTAAATIKAIVGDHPTQAGCYETLAANADTTEASADLVGRVGAVEACRQTWITLDSAVDTTNLVSCINPNGGRGVFPAARGVSPESACGQIGWQPDAGADLRR